MAAIRRELVYNTAGALNAARQMGTSTYCWALYGRSRAPLYTESLLIRVLSQGGGIATAFTASFPHLTSNKVALIASAGLMEVRPRRLHPFRYFQPIIVGFRLLTY